MDALVLRRSILLGFAYFLAAVTGAADAMSSNGALQFFLSWLIAFAVVLACVVDAHIAGRLVPPGVQLIMLFTWPIAVPACLVWARGWRGLLWFALLAITLSGTYVLAVFLFFALATAGGAGGG